jgi:hypothetical protein
LLETLTTLETSTIDVVDPPASLEDSTGPDHAHYFVGKLNE